jgi:hypothetical protein
LRSGERVVLRRAAMMFALAQCRWPVRSNKGLGVIALALCAGFDISYQLPSALLALRMNARSAAE